MYLNYNTLLRLRRVPVEGKHQCLICVKYRIIILIIIIISLGQILLSYIANTSSTHALRMHAAHTCARTRITHTYTRHLRSGSMRRWRPSMTKLTPSFMAGSWVIQINTCAGDPIYPRFWMFFAYKKCLGRTETRTRDRMYCQTIRTVRDISRDDRARIATCSLRTPTDFKRRIYSR